MYSIMATSMQNDAESTNAVEETESNLQEFKEIEEIRKLIASLKKVCTNQTDREVACERFTC